MGIINRSGKKIWPAQVDAGAALDMILSYCDRM